MLENDQTGLNSRQHAGLTLQYGHIVPIPVGAPSDKDYFHLEKARGSGKDFPSPVAPLKWQHYGKRITHAERPTV
jgi:hypothetical protein